MKSNAYDRDDTKDLRLGALITVSAGIVNTSQLILALLKLFGRLTCSWFWVLLPLILESVIPLTIALVYRAERWIDAKKEHKENPT